MFQRMTRSGFMKLAAAAPMVVLALTSNGARAQESVVCSRVPSYCAERVCTPSCIRVCRLTGFSACSRCANHPLSCYADEGD